MCIFCFPIFCLVTTRFPELTGKRNGFIFWGICGWSACSLFFGPYLGLKCLWWLRGYWEVLFTSPAYAFRNIRLFKHAIELVRGKYDDPKQVGEVSHFRPSPPPCPPRSVSETLPGCHRHWYGWTRSHLWMILSVF